MSQQPSLALWSTGPPPTAYYVVDGLSQLGLYVAEALVLSPTAAAADLTNRPHRASTPSGTTEPSSSVAPMGAPIFLIPSVVPTSSSSAATAGGTVRRSNGTGTDGSSPTSRGVGAQAQALLLHPRVAVLQRPLSTLTLRPTDVVVYCCTSFSFSALTAVLFRVPSGNNTSKRETGGAMNRRRVEGPRLVVLSNLETQPAVHTGLQSLPNHCVSWVQVHHFGPPQSRLPATPSAAAPSAFVGPLEHICLGVALGVTRFLPLHASTPADIVPVDVALETALAAMALMEDGAIPAIRWQEAPGGRTTIVSSSPSSTATARGPAGNTPPARAGDGKKGATAAAVGGDVPLHFRCNALSLVEKGLVWGMVAEFILDYYGRFAAQIAAAFPIKVFVDTDPTIGFTTHLPDLWNWGINLTAPLDAYRRRMSQSQKNYLERFPYSTTVERLKDALQHIDRGIAVATTVSPAARTTYDSGSYLMVLRRLAATKGLVDVLFKASLDHVYWDMYVKRTAVSVLHYLAQHVLLHASPLHLPAPLPAYHNDFHFKGERRAPEPNFLLRRQLKDVHAMVRGGQQPNGNLIELHSGSTPQRFMGILAQPHIERLVTQLSKDQNVSRDVIQQRGLSILRGIGDTLNHRQSRTLAYIVRKVLIQLFESININADAFDICWRAMKRPRTAVVLVPSHRSYFDFIIMSYMLLVMGLPMPHIVAGEDFLGLGGLAEFLRGSGAFFMRRSFKGDPLYAALFREYVRSLVRSSQCVEFFIEGTRSRSGKTLPPKMGILKFITDAFLEPQEEIDDVLIIPVSMTYERLLEGNVYADELMGIPKPPETMGNLLKSSAVLRQNYGSINLHVAEPLSLDQFFKQQQQQQQRSGTAATTTTAESTDATAAASNKGRAGRQPPEPPSASLSTTDAKAAAIGAAPVAAPPTMAKAASFTHDAHLELLGWDITRRLEQHLVVTPSALVSAALLALHSPAEHISAVGVPSPVIASDVEWIRTAVTRRGGLMHDRYATLDGRLLMQTALPWLEPHVRVSPLQRIFTARDSGAAAKMLLSMYTNQLIHLFADEAVICAAALALQQHPAAAMTQQPREEDTHRPHRDAPPAMSNSATASDLPQSLREDAAMLPSSVGAPPYRGGGGGGSVGIVEEFMVSSGAIATTSAFLRRLLDLEFPSFLPTNPMSFDAWLRRGLDKLLDDGAIVRPAAIRRGGGFSAALGQPLPPMLLFRKSQLVRFCAQLLMPFVDSYFVTLASHMVLLTAPRVAESTVINTAHRAILDMPAEGVVELAAATATVGMIVGGKNVRPNPIQQHSGAPSASMIEGQDHLAAAHPTARGYFSHQQSSSKETLKNAVAKSIEMGVVAYDRSGPGLALALRPSYGKDGGAALMELVRRVNALRAPQPLSGRDLMLFVERLRAMHAASPPPAVSKKKSKAKL